MMEDNIYYMKFTVTPTKENQEYNNMKEATAFLWIKIIDKESALNIAFLHFKKYDFLIKESLVEPSIVNKEDFITKAKGLEMFEVAEKEGIAIYYVAVAKHKDVPSDEIRLNSSVDFNLSEHILEGKKFSNEGRCLHYKADDRCDEIIKAHSIQNKGLLSKIARKGKVYSVSDSIGDMIKNNDSIILKEIGINKFSIFKGFCKKHDNELFEPIDNNLVVTTDIKQIFLYSYRILCKEIFIQEVALKQWENVEAYKNLFRDSTEQKEVYNRMNYHKKIYDDVLKNKYYEDIRYISFNSNEALSIVFSSVFSPDYDFNANYLDNENQDLLSFSSAPTKDGWSFIFSWHKSSDKSCLKFIESLIKRGERDDNLGDLLFRFLMKSCENTAFSPIFWESLELSEQNEISKVITNILHPSIAIPRDYLQKDLSGISKWNFKTKNHNL